MPKECESEVREMMAGGGVAWANRLGYLMISALENESGWISTALSFEARKPHAKDDEMWR
jgi:hypothetical protein